MSIILRTNYRGDCKTCGKFDEIECELHVEDGCGQGQSCRLSDGGDSPGDKCPMLGLKNSALSFDLTPSVA